MTSSIATEINYYIPSQIFNIVLAFVFVVYLRRAIRDVFNNYTAGKRFKFHVSWIVCLIILLGITLAFSFMYIDSCARSHATDIKKKMIVITGNESPETVNRLWGQIAIMETKADHEHIMAIIDPLAKKASLDLREKMTPSSPPAADSESPPVSAIEPERP